MKIFDTLQRRKVEFVPIEEGKLTMYVCGPTVYNLIHIGNARPMIVFDTFRRYMEYKGYARNSVILTQPLGYEKGPNSMIPLARTVYRKYPALIRAMERRHIVYNRQTAYAAQAENEGRAFVIRPPQKLPVEHLTHDAGIMREVYATGRQTAQQLLPALKRFIETGASAINQST